jgi:soluble lytic murein transglycosylase-like protein
MRFLVLSLLSAGTAFAGEFAILASGARLYVDRHEADAAKVRLFHGTGFVELDASAVKGFDVEPGATPPPQAPRPAVGVSGRTAVVAADPRDLADAAADRYGLPRELVRSVMAAESGYSMAAISPKGAIGLMQLMPETARDLGVDPHDPMQNVDGGTRYLRDLLLRYNGGLRHALAAYNAGPGAVDRYNGIPPFAETIQYVSRIERIFQAAMKR